MKNRLLIIKLRLNKQKQFKAFSLIEVLVALGVFMVTFSTVGLLIIDTVRGFKNNQIRTEASLIIEETINSIVTIKSYDWAQVLDNSDSTAKVINISDNKLVISSGTSSNGSVTIEFTISNARRDGSGTLVESGGTEDIHTKKIVATATWTDILNIVQTETFTIYMNDWNILFFEDTTEAHFSPGSFNFTTVDPQNGGAVRLQSVVYADWCNPTISLTSHDLTGNGVAQRLVAEPGKVFMGTGSNASGLSYIQVSVGTQDPPVVTQHGTFDGYKTNDVFGAGNYAYLATDTNSEEVVILNVTSSPYSKVGWYDASGNASALAIFVSGSYGFVGESNKMHIFNLSSQTGSRPHISTTTMAGTIRAIKVVGNYAYVVTNSTTRQLEIVDISNVNSPSIVGWASMTAQGGEDVFVNTDGTRAYLATTGSATQNEVFILNISTKTGSVPMIASSDTTGMSPKGITAIENRLIVVGQNGQEYQVFRINTETAPVKCGGLEVNTGVFDVYSLFNEVGTAYSYVVTADTAAELKVIKGGPGGGNAEGQGYAPTGTFISRVFDSNNSPNYFYLDWTTGVPSGTSYRIQVRSSNASDLSGAIFVGPDGTSTSYYDQSSSTEIPVSLNTFRYFQYKIEFFSDTISTPVFEDMRIYYQ